MLWNEVEYEGRMDDRGAPTYTCPIHHLCVREGDECPECLADTLEAERQWREDEGGEG